MSADNRTEPYFTVLLDGTIPEYHTGSGDSGQTIQPGNIVYKSGTYPDPEVTVVDANYGDAFASDATIYIVEIPPSHPSFAKAYEKDTAFTALTDVFAMHRIGVGDRFWAKCSSLTANETDVLTCQTDGLVSQKAEATIDVWNAHGFRVMDSVSSASWVKVEYIGRISVDAS